MFFSETRCSWQHIRLHPSQVCENDLLLTLIVAIFLQLFPFLPRFHSSIRLQPSKR